MEREKVATAGFGIVKLGVAAGKAEASHKSELVTQLLFGETFKILEVNNEWYKVENTADGYVCWILRGEFIELTEDEFAQHAAHKLYLTFDPVSRLKLNGHESLYVPCSSILPNFDPETNHGTIGDKQYSFDGNIVPFKQKPSAEKVLIKANKMLNAPYLWGGKTIMGIDCSGLVQSVFKACGLQLPRDAKDQSLLGHEVKNIADAHAADLAFFANAEGKITHVGIVMGNSKIIHASSRVKVNAIDEKGILDDELGGYSHTLTLIKRVI